MLEHLRFRVRAGYDPPSFSAQQQVRRSRDRLTGRLNASLKLLAQALRGASLVDQLDRRGTSSRMSASNKCSVGMYPVGSWVAS